MTGTVRLIRRVSFSSGHRYWLGNLSSEENKRLFGPWASPYNHGHNYVLDVSTEGEPDPETGMVVNIKTIDDLLKQHVVSKFDGKSINDEIAYFAETPPSLENILAYVKSQMTVLPAEAALVGLRLEETPLFWAEMDKKDDWKLKLTRSYEFAASHRLYSPALSEKENVDLFGKCANPAGHGHNYILEVSVSGEPDARTGMIVDLEKLDEKVNALVVDRYDHKNLNVDLPEFQGRMTTSEVVAQEIWRALEGNLPAKLEKVRLQETARNIFEVSAE